MKLHWLQHVPFEGLGCIAEWAEARRVDVSCTRFYTAEKPPATGTFDWLVAMGGPMGIHDHDEHPWLVAEKALIKESIDAGKTVLGICLGAQLVADALGAKVYSGSQKEIGWFPIHRTQGASELLPEASTVFHWHGDTFDIPGGATRLAASEACRNQGFVYNNRVVALQFHMETTAESMEALIQNCPDELADAPFIQTAKQMRAGLDNIEAINAAMKSLLDQLAKRNKHRIT